MPYPPWKGLSSVCKTLKNKKNLMAILLVVLPNSTILDPSKPKTCPRSAVEPPGWWPLLIWKSSPLFFIQALMNYIPVKFQRSKWRHLLSIRYRKGAAFKESPANIESGHVNGGCSCVAGQGLFFLFSWTT